MNIEAYTQREKREPTTGAAVKFKYEMGNYTLYQHNIRNVLKDEPNTRKSLFAQSLSFTWRVCVCVFYSWSRRVQYVY